MAEKAQREADTDDSDVFSHPSSPTTHHRPGHGGVHRHHRRVSGPHGESHHHGISPHRDGSQDFHDNAFSRHSHRFHHSSSLFPDTSCGAFISHHSYGEDHFDDEHHHGSRRHHGRPHQHRESYHHGILQQHRESHHHGGFHHHSEVSHHSGLYHQGVPYNHGGFSHSGSPAQHSEAHHHGGHHHHEAHHHRRPASMGSYQRDEHLHGHRDERQHREHQHGAHPRDYLHREHRYGEYRRGSSQLFGPHTSHSVASASLGSACSRQVAPQPSKPDRQSSAFSLACSLNTAYSHPAQTSSKLHPQGSSSKTSESWPEEDEQIQKHKTGRAPRTHKKLHTVDLFYLLWEKLSHLIWGLSRMLRKLTDSLAFEAFIVFIVCLNTIMLVAQTFAEVEVRGEWYFMALDSIFLCIYVVEAVLKIIALGLKYFLDPWNNLDFFIMIMAVLEFILMQINSSSMRVVYNQSIFRIFKVFKSLRALRAIRVLRRLSFLTSLQEVTGTLAQSLPSITAILILMFTCVFLFSVVLRALFRYSDPKRFQNIFTTIFTLFTLLTLDDWSLIYLDSRAQGAWYIIPILMIYIIIQYFIFLNLVIAVLVDNFQMALLKGLEKVKQEKASQIHEKLLDDSLTELMEAEPEEVISGHTIQKQLIEKKFGGMTEKQQELLFHFLQLVSGVEHYQQKFRSQAAVIDEIVDTVFEAGDEDFRK
ncbi:cation channel sperm-associated protein 1 [Phocoena sinus]|uniref:cation channel sperm-associated protein 1 n=1 Tax=Phocoena sinus TaxID=42100 RepID=UPI0013C52B32|nr:cation channel sperm-associated protein 1 [Phocoena sinus]